MHPVRALKYARARRAGFVSELKEFLRFPTVSSEPQRADDIMRCARWLARHLQGIGMERAQIIPTRGNPLVFASWEHATGKPTLLIYGHYDVVPVGSPQQWRIPPFTPTVRGENLYGRGACDDKGQLFCHIKAIESYLHSARSLPVNVKCLFEGEEEIGSPQLLKFVAQNQRALGADAAVISDTRMLAPGRPAISYSQRGGLRAELEVLGPREELHSGTFGGAVLNPIQAVCEIVARLHDERGRVRIPGFYDDVLDVSKSDRTYMLRTGPSDEKILRDASVEHGWGEPDYTLYERTTIRPALTLNGIAGGHGGPGAKGIIPRHAVAKLSFRLVPDQNPERIGRLLREHIARITPPEVQSSVRTFSPVQPALIDRNHPAVRKAAVAYKQGFGALAVFVRSGGSIPVVNAFQESLGIPTVLMGFGLPGDRIHAANEKFYLPNLFRGIDTSIWYLAMMGSSSQLKPSERWNRRKLISSA
jgi:acetylornithine deacetylase/succinyl-diaminopimelate desuccinylase-like protein